MNKDEQKFSAWLRRKLPGHVARIESCIGAGIPDISWSHPIYGEHWIETKIITHGVILDKEQYAWGMRRQKCGGSVMIIAIHENINMIKVFKFPIKVSGGSSRFLMVISRPDAEFLRSKFNLVYLSGS